MNTDELLSVKELAVAIKKHPNYIYAARARGFKMPGGLATVTEFRAWLSVNEPPRRRLYCILRRGGNG